MSRYRVLTRIASLRLRTVFRVVPGSRIVRTTPHTPKFKGGSEGRGGDCADTLLLPQLADHAWDADVLSAGLEIKCDIVNGRATRNFRTHPLRRWCHVAGYTVSGPLRVPVLSRPAVPNDINGAASTHRHLLGQSWGQRRRCGFAVRSAPRPSALIPRGCSHFIPPERARRRLHEMPAQ